MSPRLTDALLALGLAAAMLLQLVLADEPGATAVGIVGALAVTLPLAWRRRAPLAVVLTSRGAPRWRRSCSAAACTPGSRRWPRRSRRAVSRSTRWAPTPPSAARRSGSSSASPGCGPTVVATGDTDLQSFLFSGGLVATAPWLAGRSTRARALRLAAVEREREQRARTAVSEERRRIARELHDVVAHGVVLMVLQAQGARRILDQDPERARAALDAIEETGRTALAEIRASLGMLRDEARPPSCSRSPRSATWTTLVARDARGRAAASTCTVAGRPRELAVGVDRAAYRVVQEALTNAIQHAGPVPTP